MRKERARSIRPAIRSATTVERVLDAAEALVREGTFHLAAMDELAERAGVSRATVFSRFGSKLGVLEALNERCGRGPEIRALVEALSIDDPREALAAVVAASCDVWERQGFILEQLKAIVVLEPGASTLIAAQRDFQRSEVARLVQRLARARQLRRGVAQPVAVATLHMLMSLETFLELRREGGLTLPRTRGTITELAETLLR